jgi:cytochrome c-type biogenesis protein CcmE
MKKYWKFAVLVGVILGSIGMIMSGTTGTANYYKTIGEISKMGPNEMSKHIRVVGDVKAGSIQHKGADTYFTIVEQDATKPAQAPLFLNVAYSGRDPLPDTFRDGAQTLAEGTMGADGYFHAQKIQAKCASKYATKPGQAPPGLQPATAPTTYKSSGM